jgi:hypothetical protein
VDVEEPGLDIHEWETEYADLEERMRDDPSDALFELDELVARMLVAQGFPLREQDGETEIEPETIREFLEARRITQQIGAAEDVDPGDIASAINAYRELYEMLLKRDIG